jgi:hypothetical protein
MSERRKLIRAVEEAANKARGLIHSWSNTEQAGHMARQAVDQMEAELKRAVQKAKIDQDETG